MLITKIELENVTTHKLTSIEFQKGLNVLSGDNGTGKSTILNMIGFNLFDHLAGKQKDYLREDQTASSNYGIIKVWIVGLNDDHFLIERTLGKKSNNIEVSEVRTGIIVSEVSNKSTLEEWLKNQISLRQEFDLSNLFRTCIGVPQGTFTEPFLRSPQGRKNFFDPILQIEIYRTIWKKLHEVEKLYSDEIQMTNLIRREIKGMLLIKDDYIEEIEDLEEKVSKLEKEEKIFKTRLSNLSEKYDTLNSLKEELDQVSQKLALIEKEKDSLNSLLENQTNQMKEAIKADKICSITEKDHQKFISLSDELTQLNQKNEELQSSKEKFTSLEKDLLELETSIENCANRIKEIESLKKDFNRSKEYLKEYEELEQKVESQLNLTSKFSNYHEQVSNFREKYTNLSIEIDEKESGLKNIQKLEEKIAYIEKVDAEAINLECSIAKMKGELQIIEYNIESSKGNICPFLKEPCKNIGDRKLDEMIGDKLQEISPNIRKKEEELIQIKKELEDLDKYKVEYENLMREATLVEILKNQKLELGGQIKDLLTLLKNKEVDDLKLEELKKQKLKIQPYVDDYHILKEKLEKTLPSLKKDFDHFQTKREPILQKMKPIKKKIKKLAKVPLQIKNISDQIDNVHNNYLLYNKNEVVAKSLPSLKSKVDKTKQSLREKESEILKLEKHKTYKESQFDVDDYKEIGIEKEETNKKYIKIQNSIDINKSRIKDINLKITSLSEKQKELDDLNQHLGSLEFISKFIGTMRTWFKEASPKITEILIRRINSLASDIFRDLMDITNVDLIWENDYNIKIITSNSQKDFHQLSGGEQMAAALSVRLAILKILTNIDFAFFDEPTTNLDKEKRINLAKCIQNIKGFEQLFIISHDDTFAENAENVIKFTKDDNEVTQVQFLSK